MTEITSKRVPNFASSETELLTTLVKRYSSVLENKKTDVVNNQIKEETWCKLAQDFNSTSGLYHRNAKTLRAKYENLKKSLKRKYGEHRRSLYRTGGGPPQDLNLTQEEEVIMELAGPSVEGLPARFDSDTIPDCNKKNISQPQVIVMPTNVVVQSEDTNFIDEMESQVHAINATATAEVFTDSTPSRFLLKRKRSTPLTHRNPEAFTNTMKSYSNLSKKKEDFVEAQIRDIEEKAKQQKIEHELRCAQLANRTKQDLREHELRCELMMLDIKLKIKMLQSESDSNNNN